MEAKKPLTAFIFANGDTNDGPVVQQTLATHPGAWIIAADGGARQALHFGLQPQVVIGDMDSLSPEELSNLEQSGSEIRRYPPEKDETDLELALLLAASGGVRTIRLFAALGDRLDQTISNIYLLALPTLHGLDVRLVAGKQEVWLAFPGETTIQGTAGDTISLVPLNGEVHGVRTTALYYPLNNETLRFGPARGVSNVMTGSSASVSLETGVLLVIHTLGRA